MGIDRQERKLINLAKETLKFIKIANKLAEAASKLRNATSSSAWDRFDKLNEKHDEAALKLTAHCEEYEPPVVE